jgi:hypothetical protein
LISKLARFNPSTLLGLSARTFRLPAQPRSFVRVAVGQRDNEIIMTQSQACLGLALLAVIAANTSPDEASRFLLSIMGGIFAFTSLFV